MAARTNSSSSSPLVELSVATTLPIKLSSTNYPTWYKQITNLLDANKLPGYANGTLVCPLAKLGTSEAATDNPDFLQWKRQDNYVFFALMGSCGFDA